MLGLDHFVYDSAIDARQSLSATLTCLRKEGLIIRDGSRKKTVWRISRKGGDYIKTHSKLSAGVVRILPISDGVKRLVIFDIAEKNRKERTWLRKELIACGFSCLQKSVYFGDCPLSEDLVKEIYEKGLGKTVHVMSLDKLGTITKKD